MNPLINAEIGMLYTTDSRFLAKIKYTRNPDSYTFIFSSLPESPLPKQVYLMPGEAPNDYTSFLCTTTGVFNEFYVPQTIVDIYAYFLRYVPKHADETQEAIREETTAEEAHSEEVKKK